jgi:hypothetical protein
LDLPSFNLKDHEVYRDGELHKSSISRAIDKINSYAGAKLGSESAAYKEIYSFGESVFTVLGSYKAMIPDVLKENTDGGIDDPIAYYGETLPILKDGKTVADVKKLYADKYNTELVSYRETVDEAGFIAATTYSGKDTMTVSVAGNEERILLIALYDNLGKGASGAAVECMNIALGADKTQGLDI